MEQHPRQGSEYPEAQEFSYHLEQRRRLFQISEADQRLMIAASPVIEAEVGTLVRQFFDQLGRIPEIAVLLQSGQNQPRLRTVMRGYILELFSGQYDLDYVASRLNAALAHKRLGIDSTLFLAALQQLKSLLGERLMSALDDIERCISTLAALDRVFMFDLSLVFDTYVRNLLTEVEAARRQVQQYAQSLEDKVRERTRQLEELARTDPLTGLLSVRYLRETLTHYLRSAERRRETLCVVYIDIDDFKQFNDSAGHHRGDEVLCILAEALRRVSREVDACFRYGGDEFCVLLPNCNEAQARHAYIDRLNRAIDELGEQVELSVGVIEAGPGDYQTTEALIRLADSAMYAHKARAKRRRHAVSQARG